MNGIIADKTVSPVAGAWQHSADTWYRCRPATEDARDIPAWSYSWCSPTQQTCLYTHQPRYPMATASEAATSHDDDDDDDNEMNEWLIAAEYRKQEQKVKKIIIPSRMVLLTWSRLRRLKTLNVV